MSNKPTRRKAQRPTRRPTPAAAPPPLKRTVPKSRLWMWIILAVIVVGAAAGIAIWSASDNGDVTEGSVVGTDNVSSPAETQPVTVAGDALAPQASNGVDHSVDGTTPPALHGFHFDGTPMDITPGGKAQMVVFLAHWCPHCNREVPRLLEWKASGQIPANLDIVGVSTAAAADRDNYPPSQWVKTIGWAWPIMADSKNQDAARGYGLGGYPTFVIVGADGKVKVRFSGEIEIADLTTLVNQALAS
jgi:cytochrome c biogenesis protein CcmG, thiol:disulfide interchange protein DsbE